MTNLDVPEAAVKAAAQHMAAQFARQAGYSLDQVVTHVEDKWPRYVDEARGIIRAALPLCVPEGFEALVVAAKEMMQQDAVQRATELTNPFMASAADKLESALRKVGER